MNAAVERTVTAALRRVDREIARRGRMEEVVLPGYRSAAEFGRAPARAITYNEWREAVAALRAALAARGVPLRLVYSDHWPTQPAGRAAVAAAAPPRRLAVKIGVQSHVLPNGRRHSDHGIGWTLLDIETKGTIAGSGEDKP